MAEAGARASSQTRPFSPTALRLPTGGTRPALPLSEAGGLSPRSLAAFVAGAGRPGLGVRQAAARGRSRSVPESRGPSERAEGSREP